MDGLAKAGHIQDAKSVFDEMNEKNVKSGMASDRCSSYILFCIIL